MIDTHGHVMGKGYPLGSDYAIAAKEMLEVIDRHGISQIWLSHCNAMAFDDSVYNRELYLEYVKPYPDRFVGFACVDPFKGMEHCREEIRRCAEEYGFKGIKIHSWIQGFAIHHPILYDVMEMAGRYGMPVLFHDGTPPYADTSQIAGMAERFPEVPVILGHAGLYDSYRAAISASQQLDNIYLCLVGSTIQSIAEMLKKARRNRILFGSDFCFGNDPDVYQTLIDDRLDSLREAADGEEIDDILYGNAGQIIK